MRIAVLTDLHLGPKASFAGKLRKLSDHARPFLDSLVTQLNQEAGSPFSKPDLFINLGDVLEDESADADLLRYGEFVQTLAQLSCPVLHVAGNHDRINLKDEQLVELWRQSGLNSAQLFYSKDISGVHFSVLATDEVKDRDVRLEEQQLRWLSEDLNRTELPCIVCVHHPLSDCDVQGNHWFERAPHLCRVVERKAFRRVIEQSGKVLCVLNGHAHWNHLDIIQQIPYITFQSPIENVQDDAPGLAASTFGWLELSPKRLLVRVVGQHPAHYQFELTEAQKSRVQAAFTNQSPPQIA